jgi:hypothetical protein
MGLLLTIPDICMTIGGSNEAYRRCGLARRCVGPGVGAVSAAVSRGEGRAAAAGVAGMSSGIGLGLRVYYMGAGTSRSAVRRVSEIRAYVCESSGANSVSQMAQKVSQMVRVCHTVI